MQLNITDITKVYSGGTTAVSGITARIGRGVMGLLGPNGAGKSSLMRIIATVTRPTAGQLTWNGTDVLARPDELRRVLGYLPQDFGVYPQLTAPEFLTYLAAIKGLSGRSARARVAELLETVHLTEARKQLLGRYSGGMRQRVGIARALTTDPKALLMDEPFGALDAQTRGKLQDELLQIWQQQRTTVLFVTHSIDEALLLADRILVFTPRPGRIAADIKVDLPRPRAPQSAAFTALARELRGLVGADREID
jgi:ABC-type nitrate/sulfonate/bicarbonate transport system ATPase subunit